MADQPTVEEDAATLLHLLVSERGPMAPGQVRRSLEAVGFALDPPQLRAVVRRAGLKVVEGPKGPLVVAPGQAVGAAPKPLVPPRATSTGPDPLQRFQPAVLLMAFLSVLLVVALFLAVMNPGGRSRPITTYRPPPGAVH